MHAIEERYRDPAAAMLADEGREIVRRPLHELPAYRRQPFDDEDGVPCGGRQFRAVGLLPVPAPADRPGFILVDHLAGLRRPGLRLAEKEDRRLVRRGDRQQDVSLDSVQVFSAHWHEMAQRDRVVEVDEGVDARQWLALQRAPDEVLDRRRMVFRFGAELPVGLAPGRDVGMFGDLYACQPFAGSALFAAEALED